MCGLFGFNGKNKPVIAKLKILGLYNITRGKDSCGYWFNGAYERSKAYNEQEFDDYIEKNVIKNPTKSDTGYTFIGHTRQGSAGYGKTLDNAHPFIIDGTFVIAHNGTLQNHEELLTNYGIDEKFSVDSKALGTLINRYGFNILNEYVGYAALMMTDVNDPGTLMVYHGQSRTIKNGAITEERPLYFLETKEGVYFSSLRESLLAIKEEGNEDPKNLIYNKVIFFEKGIYNAEKTIDINREDMNVGINMKSSCSTYWPETTNAYGHYHQQQGVVRTLPPVATQRASTVTTVLPTKNKIWLENISPFKSDLDRRMYFHRGRYHDSFTKDLADGFYEIERGRIIRFIEEIPSDVIINNENSNIFFFIRGVMIERNLIKTIASSTKVMTDLTIDYKTTNFALLASNYSKYPVSLLEDEYPEISDSLKFVFWKNGKLYSNNHFSPIFTNRHYHIDTRGYLYKIVSQDTTETSHFMTQQEYNIFLNSKNLKKTEGGIIIPNENIVEQFNTGTEIDTYSEEVERNNDANIYKGLFAKFTTDPKTISGLAILYRILFKVFDSEDELAAELPDTIIKAVEITVKEQMLETSESVSLDLVRKEADRMIESCAIRKVNLYTLFTQQNQSPEYYIYQAYKQEELENLPITDTDEILETETEDVDEASSIEEVESYLEDIIVNDMEGFYSSAQLLCTGSDMEEVQEIAKAIYDSMDNLKSKMINLVQKGNFKKSLLRELTLLNSNAE